MLVGGWVLSMKLSILDQAPVSNNQTPQSALFASKQLAQAGERFGYTRFWIAEHHDLNGLACSAPEVMLSYIGAHTHSIRLGSGAVLLPHYKPYKIAEVFNLLATLFPNRIDLGIGRAPGGSAEATEALSDHFLQQVWKMPELIEELLFFLQRDFPEDHKYSKLKASPVPEVSPEAWLLGTSRKSAKLAATNGMSYAFGQFMSELDGAEIILEYINSFQPNKQGQKPSALVTVNAYCAETTQEAEEIALSSLVWQVTREKNIFTGAPSIEDAKKIKLDAKEQEQLTNLKEKMIIGNPQEVRDRLNQIKEKYLVDEIMIVTITHSLNDKIQSYKLIADSVLSK